MNMRAVPASHYVRTVFAALVLSAAVAGHAEETSGAASATTGAAARQAARAAAAADAEPAATPPTDALAKPRAKTPAAAAGVKARQARAMDTLELETTQITGNRELPKFMVVVPWKRSDIGDLVGRPVNSLVDEALAPVDREVFKREIAYFGALSPDRRNETPVTPGATGAPVAKPEK